MFFVNLLSILVASFWQIDHEKQEVEKYFEQLQSMITQDSGYSGIITTNTSIKIYYEHDLRVLKCESISNEAFCRIEGPAKVELSHMNEEFEFYIGKNSSSICYAGTQGMFCVQ